MAITIPKIEPFWNNPVIIRDMRVRMRGNRAFNNQGLYLGLLCVVATLGYAASTGTNSGEAFDPIAVQQKLQEFYYWIFETLAVMITVIAPALTAASIVNERKMQTIDLLVTTPMTSMQMLTGKLISSIAFVLLLLVLSIPASALCVILGGATIGDVLQSYLLLAIDGVLMSAIGLFFSCSAKQHVNAIVGSFGAIILLMIVTAILGESLMSAVFRLITAHTHDPVPAIAAFVELNPFFAAALPGFSVSLFGLNIPVWIATAIVCAILVRIILTSAALRLGMYGANLFASLRRQILGASIVGTLIISQGVTSFIGAITGNQLGIAIIVMSTIAFGCAVFFLPALFVPVIDEEGPPNQVIQGSFDFRQTFSGQHSGTLPYYLVWLISVLICTCIGFLIPSGSGSIYSSMGMHVGMSGTTTSTGDTLVSALESSGAMMVYLSGLGYLLWSVSRRTAWLSGSATVARPLSFFIFLFIFIIPMAVLITESQLYDGFDAFKDSIVSYFWLLYPYGHMVDSPYGNLGSLDLSTFAVYGVIAAVLGLIFYLPWRDVTPGGMAMSRMKNSKGPSQLTYGS